MSRSPSGYSPKFEVVPVGFRSPPTRVEEKYWSHFAPHDLSRSSACALRLECSCEHSSRKAHRKPLDPMSSVCRSLRAIPPPDDLGTTQAGHFGSTTRTPASLKGSLTRRILSCLISRCVLADECNRPNCQRRTAASTRGITTNWLYDPEGGGLASLLIHRHHRPVQACLTATYPGRRLALGY